MTQAFISLAADRVVADAPQWVAGALQQRTQLFMEGKCVCVVLVTFPESSPEYERAAGARLVKGVLPGLAEVVL